MLGWKCPTFSNIFSVFVFSDTINIKYKEGGMLRFYMTVSKEKKTQFQVFYSGLCLNSFLIFQLLKINNKKIKLK